MQQGNIKMAGQLFILSNELSDFELYSKILTQFPIQMAIII